MQARRKPLGSHGQATTSSHCLFNVRFVRFAQNRILKFAIGIYLLKSAGVTRKPLLLLPECCLPSLTTSSKRTNPIIPSFMLTLTTLRRIIGRFPWRRLSLFSSVRASVFQLLLFNLVLYPSIFRLLRGSLFCHALLAIPLFRNISNFLSSLFQDNVTNSVHIFHAQIGVQRQGQDACRKAARDRRFLASGTSLNTGVNPLRMMKWLMENDDV